MKQYFYLKDILAVRQFEWVVEEFNNQNSERHNQFLSFREKILKGEVDKVWNGVKNEFLALSLCMIGVPVCDYNGFTYNLDIKEGNAKIIKQPKLPNKLDKILDIKDAFEIKTEQGDFAFKLTGMTSSGFKCFSATRYKLKYKTVKCDPFSSESKYIPEEKTLSKKNDISFIKPARPIKPVASTKSNNNSGMEK